MALVWMGVGEAGGRVGQVGEQVAAAVVTVALAKTPLAEIAHTTPREIPSDSNIQSIYTLYATRMLITLVS